MSVILFLSRVNFAHWSRYFLLLISLSIMPSASRVFAKTATSDQGCQVGQPAELGGQPNNRQESCFIDGQILIVKGIIGPQTLQAIREQNIRHLILNSPGGSVSMAISLAEEVSIRKIQTEIPENGYCYSSCTLVFQSGVQRTAHATADFLYHCTGLGLFGTQIIQQNCGPDHTKYQGTCAQELEDLVQITIESTAKYFENYEKYGATGLYERLQSEPDLPNWFESGNFCKKRLQISAAETMIHNVVEILKQ